MTFFWTDAMTRTRVCLPASWHLPCNISLVMRYMGVA